MSDPIVLTVAITLGVPLGIYVLMYLFSLKVVEKGTAMIVERNGRFHRKVGGVEDGGTAFLWPLIDRIRPLKWRTVETQETNYNNRISQTVRYSEYNITRIDLREACYNFPNQKIFTRDNVEVEVHPMLLYKIVDPVRAVYEIYDLAHALERLVQTALRSIIGDMGLDDTLASRLEINHLLISKISNVCLNWGVEITSVEILGLQTQADVQQAMHQQISAERERRAAVVTAEGYYERVHTTAEGECQSSIAIAKGQQKVHILRAKGYAESQKLMADAEAQSITLLSEALKAYKISPAEYLIASKYLDAFKEVATKGQSRTMFFPYESDLSGRFYETEEEKAH